MNLRIPKGSGMGGIVGVFGMDMYTPSIDNQQGPSIQHRAKKKKSKSMLMRDPELDTPS